MQAVLTFEESIQKTLVPKQVVGLTAVLLTGAALTPINMQAVNEFSGVVGKVTSQSQERLMELNGQPQTNLKIMEEKAGAASYSCVNVRNLSLIEAQKKIGELQDKITSSVLTWRGIPYKWGGRTKAGVDCSGLVQRIFLENGIKLPRTSYEQFKMGVGIPKTKLQPGDLVFFTTNGAGASHVGIYLSSGKFISATKNLVEVQSLDDPYWAKTYRGSRRIIGQ